MDISLAFDIRIVLNFYFTMLSYDTISIAKIDLET